VDEGLVVSDGATNVVAGVGDEPRTSAVGALEAAGASCGIALAELVAAVAEDSGCFFTKYTPIPIAVNSNAPNATSNTTFVAVWFAPPTFVVLWALNVPLFVVSVVVLEGRARTGACVTPEESRRPKGVTVETSRFDGPASTAA
jgi:hypothetical protein